MARTSSYYLYEKFEKRGDQDWIPSYPNVYSKDGDGTMPLVVRIARDYDCGWRCDPEYQWIELPITNDYICDECGELGQVTHKWEVVEGYLCEGTTKYQKLNLNVNIGNGWEEVSPIISKPGELIEEKSVDCGYENPRLRVTLVDGTVKEVPYTTGMTPTGLLGADDIMQYGIPISQIKDAEFYGGEIYYYIFAGCQTLTSVTFHNNELINGGFLFYGSGLRNFTGKIDWATPSYSTSFTFGNCKNLTGFTETSTKYHRGTSGLGHFANCTSLPSIDLSMLEEEGAAALFYGCTSLRTARISSLYGYSIGLSCFEGCTSLESVDIVRGYDLDGVKHSASHYNRCRDRAFLGCRNLTSITLSYSDSQYYPPAKTNSDLWCTNKSYSGNGYINVNYLGNFSFMGCERLPVENLENVLGIDSPEPETDYVTGYTASSTTGICSYGDGTFIDCKAFTHIPRPQWSYKVINDPDPSQYPDSCNLNRYAYEYIPVTYCSISGIGAYCFSGCSGLQSLEFDGDLTSVGEHAFDGCTGLTGVTFTGTVPPTFGRGSFHNTNNCPIYVPCGKILEYINALNNHEADDEYSSRVRGIPPCSAPTYSMKFTARYNTGDSHFVYCDSSSIITSGEVEDYTASRENITSVTIGNCATEIAKDAFKNCTGLTSVTIGTGVTTFRQSVFSSCRSLTSVDIPSNVSRIENYGFIYCRNLETVYVRASSPPYLGWTGTQHISEVFSNTSPNLVIYVPSGSVNSYRSATGWSTYASKIQPMP